MGFINWPQFYAAEAKKIKGGIFNDRKCIKSILLVFDKINNDRADMLIIVLLLYYLSLDLGIT